MFIHPNSSISRHVDAFTGVIDTPVFTSNDQGTAASAAQTLMGRYHNPYILENKQRNTIVLICTSPTGSLVAIRSAEGNTGRMCTHDFQ